MKKIFLLILAVTLITGAVSCTSDDSGSNASANELLLTLASGTWHISLYKEGDTDKTASFVNYDFIFGQASVLTATNENDTHTGYWSVDDDNGEVDLDLDFSAPASFAALSEDWQLLERTSSKVRLRHVSGGDGSTDFLTLEKN